MGGVIPPTGSARRKWGRRASATIATAGARLLGVPRIAMAREVWTLYDESGGGLLARGLAFVAVFALVPGLLLIVSIAGLFVADPGPRDQLAVLMAGQFAPLAPLIREAVDEALTSAPAFSILGMVLLVWSASSFVRGLDAALGVVFEEAPGSRGLVRVAMEVVAVAAAFVVIALVVVLLVVPSPLTDVIGARPAVRITAVPVLACIFAAAYRFLPVPRPGWRPVYVPAVWIGFATSLLTGLYAGLGQFLTSSTQFFGTFAAAFAGLLWLGWVAELFLIGAAWVRVRVRRAGGAPARG